MISANHFFYLFQILSVKIMLAKHTWSSKNIRVITLVSPNPTCCTAVAVNSGGWVSQGPGQFHGHSPPNLFMSPALRLSYTTVPVSSFVRNLHTTIRSLENESSKPPSSQVEVTVKDLKEKEKEKALKKINNKNTSKASLLQRIKSEIIHYYHGFKLLFIDVRLSSKYVMRTLHGESLSRREYRQVSLRLLSFLFKLILLHLL